MFEISDELRVLSEKVIAGNANLAHLGDLSCRIAYLYCDKEKKRSGKSVYADTEKLSDKVKAIAGYDFIITFYRPTCAGLKPEKMEILMYHELKHVGFEPGGTFRIIPHDVEDFVDIIKKYGTDWTD